MDWTSRIRSACLVDGRAPDEDVVEELAQHAAAAYERARADGRSPRDAAHDVEALLLVWRRDAATLRRRPSRPPIIEPPSAGSSALAGLGQDVRYGIRVLRRARGFALIAILTIAIGIGATTTLFSIVNGVLLKPLPWPDADRLVRLSETRQGRTARVPGTVSNGTYLAWRDEPTTIEAIGGWRMVTATAIIENGEPTRLLTASVTPSLFGVLKAQPLRGRLFVEDDGRGGGSFPSKDVIILSYGLWQERFGGRDDALGGVVYVGGKPLTIVGVMPRTFAFPNAETRAWTPWAVASVVADQGGRRVSIFSALARLHPGATAAQASAEGTSRARGAPDPGLAAAALFGGNGPAEVTATPALELMTAEVRPALLVLVAAVVLLFATATANVASLQLARAATRRREIAVRAAIGAGAGRLTRQLVVENALIGLAGGLVGFALAWALHRALPSVLPADFPRADAVAIDGRVALVVAALSMLVSIVCGVLPALHARRLNLVESLSDAGNAAPGSLRTSTTRTRTAIMVGQLAVSCVLLVGAALLSRSFVGLLHADRGYDPTNLLTARLPLPPALSLDRRLALLEAIVARVRPSPAVTEAAFGNALPLVTTGGFRAFKMRPPRDPSQEIDVNTIERVVSPGYFSALGLRLVEGRTLRDTDTMTGPQVIVVNRSFAARYLGAPAVGAMVPNLGMCRGDNDRWQVVGVVDDMRQGGVADAAQWAADSGQAEIFLPARQIGCPTAIGDPILVVKSSDDPLLHAAALRSAVREEAPTLALDSMMSMEERVMTNLAKPRLYAVVLAGFATFAVSIAGVGLFGVLAYSVAQRGREIGVRTALGARQADIVRLVLRQAARIALTATAIGLWLAFAAAKSLSRFLYGVGPHDVVSFAGAALLVVAVSAIACLVPARRAARVDPLTALKNW